MKSDREFLDGIYAKAEKSSSMSPLDSDYLIKETHNKPTPKKHTTYTKYVKYGGMVAGFILLLSSTLYLNNYTEKNEQNDDQPVPSKFRMIPYSDLIIEEATDIVEIRAKYKDDVITLDIAHNYKESANGPSISNYLNNDVIGLTADQSALVFINADSKNTPIMDIFIWVPDSNHFTNLYGEVITVDKLTNQLNK